MKPANSSTIPKPILPEDQLKENLIQANLLKYFSAKNLALLNQGDTTKLIKNIHYNGKIWDGTFQLLTDPDGTHTLHFKKSADSIEIPNPLLGKKISRVEKASLLEGKAIGPYTFGTHPVYFHLDPSTHTISLFMPKKIGIPDELMGYSLSSMDKHFVNTGKKVGPKVFCLDGHSFIGHYSIRKEAEVYLWEIQYDKEITKAEALKLIPSYNDSASGEIGQHLTDAQKQIFFIPPATERVPGKTSFINGPSFQDAPQGSSFHHKDIVGYVNESFQLITFKYPKKKGLPCQLFNQTFSMEEMNRLTIGDTLPEKVFTLHSGDIIHANVALLDQGELYRMILQINGHQANGQWKSIRTGPVFDVRKYSQNDQLIMDLIDKKDVKAIRNLAQHGIKPSENLNQLIIRNTRISEPDREMIGTIFQTEQNTGIQKETLPGSISIPPHTMYPSSGKLENQKNNGNQIGKGKMAHGTFLASLKNLFHDM